MSKFNSKNITGIYFSETLLNKDFRDSLAGHKNIHKLFVLVSGIFAAILLSIIPVFSVGIASLIIDELKNYEFSVIEASLITLILYIFSLYLVVDFKINGVLVFFIYAIIASILVYNNQIMINSPVFLGISIASAYLAVIIIALLIGTTHNSAGILGEILTLVSVTFAAIAFIINEKVSLE